MIWELMITMKVSRRERARKICLLLISIFNSVPFRVGNDVGNRLSKVKHKGSLVIATP